MTAWNRHDCKKDANHNAIKAVFERAGWTVKDTHQLKGFVDFIAGQGSKVLLVEVKSKSGKLSKDEQAFHNVWPGKIHIIRSTDEAIDLLTQIKQVGNSWAILKQ